MLKCYCVYKNLELPNCTGTTMNRIPVELHFTEGFLPGDMHSIGQVMKDYLAIIKCKSDGQVMMAKRFALVVVFVVLSFRIFSFAATEKI